MKKWISSYEAENLIGLTSKDWNVMAPHIGGKKENDTWLFRYKKAKKMMVNKKNLENNINHNNNTPDQKSVIIEQYKIAYNVIINLSDNVVKSVLTIFVIYMAIIAMVFRESSTTPSIIYVLYVNYALILMFSYYLGYLRFRIITMFKFINEIEKNENFKYTSIKKYESSTNFRFFSTKGLYVFIILVLLSVNTLIICIL